MRQIGERKKDRRNGVIVFLTVVILILVAVVAYVFAVQPMINGYVVDKQLEARDVVISALLTQVQQQGYVQLGDGQGGTVVLAPVQVDQQQMQ